MKKSTLLHLGKTFQISDSDIEAIILFSTGLTKSQLFIHDHIEDIYLKKITQSFQERKDGTPLEYIVQNTDFYGLNFFIDQRVLIPRNDTEIMIDEVLNEISITLDSENKETSFSLIDVWTGSGCIPISIIKNSQHINKAYVIDISESALEICKKNIHKHDIKNKITPLHWNLLSDFIGDKKDLNLSHNTIITANLPYIKDHDFINMDHSVIEHEPDLALYGWQKTWFELYEKLISQTQELQHIYHFQKLILFIEIGFDQYDVAKNYLDKWDLKYIFYKDTNNIFRCVKIEL